LDRTAITDCIDALSGAASLADRIDAVAALVDWLRAEGTDSYARLSLLLSVLDEPAERRRFQAAIGALLADTDGADAFAHAGIPGERGFVPELGERALNRVLPRPRDDRDLTHLLRRLFHRTAHVERLAQMPGQVLVRLVRVLSPADDPRAIASMRRSFADGFRLLGMRVQSQGLSPKLRMRSRAVVLRDSPFYRIAGVSEAIIERWLGGQLADRDAEAWRGECECCREELAEIHRRLEREGVSTDVVYGLEVVERSLARMAAMVDLMIAPDAARFAAALRSVIVALAASSNDDRSVRHLIRWNTQLLQRRIVERSGQTGEHYVTSTRSAYRQMWLGAAGGGLLTVGTAAIKTALSAWHAPDFVHGLAYGLNYAVSFLVLQRLHLVLATKQPAMTAAALAAIMRERRGVDRANDVADYTARICRSQLAAVLGNVIVVAVGAFVFVHLWQWLAGRPFMARDEAETIYEQLSPLNSGTVFYAALTGVILWLASVFGGWFDNFCAYHRLPVAIAEHPAGRYLGRERLARLADLLVRNGSGWATNISLGFMLGMTPAIGHFLGLPLDVRHVTLNSGILSLASTSLGQRWFGEGAFLHGVSGVGVMFVLNLSVSFMLALTTAVRAYNLPAHETIRLLGGVGRRFLRAPLEFFVPPPEHRLYRETAVKT
jgi:site-specific recombinase